MSGLLGNFLLDRAAPIYDWLTAQEIWRRHIRERIASQLPEGARDVLDDGTGPGVSAFMIAAARPGVRVVGLDISGPMIARARPHLAACPDRERITLVQGDAMALPFPDASFDGVTGHSFLYLMPDRAKALAEARRVLRPRGRIVLLEPRAGFRLPSWSFLREGVAQSLPFACSMFLWRLVSGVEGRFSDSGLADTLVNGGFTVLSIEPTLGGRGLGATAERSDARAAGVQPGHGDPKPGSDSWRARDWDAWWTTEIARFKPGAWESKIRPMEAMMNRLGWLRERRTRRVLVHANGVSQEPRALAYAGFDAVGLDVSSVATEFAENFPLSDAELRMFFQWDDTGHEGAFERQRREGGRHRFVCGDAFDAAIEPGPFDAVLSWRGFHGFTDVELEALARALDRRLSPTGSIHITVQNAPRTCRFLIDLFKELGYAVNRDDVTTGRVASIGIASG